MLKLETDFTREFPIILRTNRDAENPTIIEFFQRHPDIVSVLDVGAHNSHVNYASQLRAMVKAYDAIDILPDPQTEAIVDNYYVANFNDKTIQKAYDCVISVSVFEHAGLSTYKADHDTEVLNLFKNCLLYAKKYVWVSFDVGQHWVTEDQHSPITHDVYKKMLEMCKGYKVTKRFFYNQGAQANHPWYEHQKEEVAFKIPYIYYIGNQSIAVLEIEK